ncbi:nucleoside 2-deoxyribosyltransferase [Jeotgalibacillus malaysiensis]|uniref:nucleoside 2-deoxyribosyltransferase n=1 Tax=Jeotgalibacillus malaysiensis TaxID=1508404 RepID=UPI00384A7CBD
MKFYIASSFTNKEKVQYVSQHLIKHGYTLTYDWTVNERASTFEEQQSIGQKEKEEVIEADLLIALLPGGKGTHIEMGIALGQGKQVFLYSPDKEVDNPETTSTFYHLPGVRKCFGTLDELIDMIIENG